MGTKEIMVGHGQHDTLVSTAYGKILQDPADECIDWYASVIKKAWEDRPKPAQLKELRALEMSPSPLNMSLANGPSRSRT
jgi:hypothetical protein